MNVKEGSLSNKSARLVAGRSGTDGDCRECSPGAHGDSRSRRKSSEDAARYGARNIADADRTARHR